jgi:hypothetical protein
MKHLLTWRVARLSQPCSCRFLAKQGCGARDGSRKLTLLLTELSTNSVFHEVSPSIGEFSVFPRASSHLLPKSAVVFLAFGCVLMISLIPRCIYFQPNRCYTSAGELVLLHLLLLRGRLEDMMLKEFQVLMSPKVRIRTFSDTHSNVGRRQFSPQSAT